MASHLSDAEEAAFAAIVARLGDPERRPSRRLALTLGSSVLIGAIVLLALVLHAPWTITASFSAAFLLGMGVGWAVIERRSSWCRTGRYSLRGG